jgi:excinuclease ABC subunit A
VSFSKDKIKVIGAREHNLKSITVEIPKGKLVVVTGPSGSGKSSLALDTIYSEGKRRYVESLSAYARQFLGVAKRPNVERIEGLCPAVAIDQKTVSSNPRSTVGTVTEIYDYLRVLFARIGKAHCPSCGLIIESDSPENITKMLIKKFKNQTVTIAAPIAIEKKGEFKNELLKFFEDGFYRFMIDGKSYRFTNKSEVESIKLGKKFAHTIDLLIDKISVSVSDEPRLQEGIEKATSLTNGLCKINEEIISLNRICIKCARSFQELEPRFFSFNSPVGACQTCHGLGFIQKWPWKEGDRDYWKSKYPSYFGKYSEKKECRDCLGKRLCRQALSVTIDDKNIYEISNYSIKDALYFFSILKLSETETEVAAPLLKEILNRLHFLNDVGLSYLTLGRMAKTLSGGESQRIRLATQVGSALSGVVYILDEPSIGLHQRDNDRLIKTLKKLRDHGNTVIVVEHDLDTIRQADYVIDIGPASGDLGGEIISCGTPSQVARDKKSITGAYLSGKKVIKIPERRRKPHKFIRLTGAHTNNLKNLNVDIPLEVFCAISGVSGSGKSSLIVQTLAAALQHYCHRGRKIVGNFEKLEGVEQIKNVVVVDQSPIGRTPRSNPATYLGIFDEIRKLYASLPESNSRGYKPGQFSFNVKVGRCFNCNGDGQVKIPMHFLEDVTLVCKKCAGKRYNSQTLEIKYKEKNIADVLNMTARDALKFFASFSRISKKLKILCDVGLDYIKLGQSSKTLSGGEAQRIKLVNELAKRGQNTLYILDEPTTGLHSCDVEKLLGVLNCLVDQKNSVWVIEHNIDVLKSADYIVDVGPEGGDGGGEIVVRGTPEKVTRCKKSHTGRYLKRFLFHFE